MIKSKSMSSLGAASILLVLCAASDASVLLGHGAADDVVAVGPVAAISVSAHEVTVLGRTFYTQDPVGLAPGDYVAVHADMKPDGTLSDVWIEIIGQYVPGSDLVYEKGVVTDVKPFLGQLSIGSSKVDYTPSLYNSSVVGPSIGDIVAVSGVQPQGNSVVLVDSLSAAADIAKNAVLLGKSNSTASIQGSGVRSASIQGSGVRNASIQGSGLAAR